MAETILVLNAGSSSIKFTLFGRDGERLDPLYDGQIEGIGVAPRFKAKDGAGAVLLDRKWEKQAGDGHSYALEQLAGWLIPQLGESTLLGVGHRVVHGGPEFTAPTLMNDEILQRLDEYSALAPLHNPANVAGIRAARAYFPAVPQVACFDTAFHRRHPEVADRYAIPEEFYAAGVRRYGFHGLSYEYIAQALHEVAPEIAQGKVVVAHLGNGASMAALQNGRSMDSTMGFTALDGLPMGTRSGQIDPGVLLFFMQEKGMDAKQIEELLYRRSGLLGLSGVSSDMRDLLASDDPRATLAVDYFIYHICRQVGALAAAMEGIDGLVFTAGIGENAAPIRARVIARLGWLGIELDAAANDRRGPRISTPQSRVSAWVVPTDEEQMIARATLAAI